MGRSTHWLGDIIGIFFASIIIFLLIFFFAPEISLKFFGFSFSQRSDVSDAIVEYFDNMDLDTKELDAFFSTQEGKEVLDKIIELSKEGSSEALEKLNSEDVKAVLDKAKEYAEAGLGTMSDYLKNTFNTEALK